MNQTTVVLSSFGGGSLERRTRTSESGASKDRYTITLDANPIVLDFDTKTLGRGVSNTIAEHLRKRVSEIGAVASAKTQSSRKRAAKALAKGESAAVKRYSGGRMGTMPPNQSPRLFNDSGRFSQGIASSPTRDNNWIINVPANRLNAAQLGSEAALKRIVDQLRSYVPEFGSAVELVKVPIVQNAIRESAKNIRMKAGLLQFRRIHELAKEISKSAIEEFSKADERAAG